MSDTEDRKIVRLSRPRREDDLGRRGPNQRCNVCPGIINDARCPLTRAVWRSCITGECPCSQHRVTRFRGQRQCCEPVEKNRRRGHITALRQRAVTRLKSGRASCRERGGQYEKISVVAVAVKKQKEKEHQTRNT